MFFCSQNEKEFFVQFMFFVFITTTFNIIIST